MVIKLCRQYRFLYLPNYSNALSFLHAFNTNSHFCKKKIKEKNTLTVPQPFQRPTQNSSSPSALPQGSLPSGLCTPTGISKHVSIQLCVCMRVSFLNKCKAKDRNTHLLVFLLAPIPRRPQSPRVIIDHISKDHLPRLYIDSKLDLKGQPFCNMSTGQSGPGV